MSDIKLWCWNSKNNRKSKQIWINRPSPLSGQHSNEMDHWKFRRASFGLVRFWAFWRIPISLTLLGCESELAAHEHILVQWYLLRLWVHAHTYWNNSTQPASYLNHSFGERDIFGDVNSIYIKPVPNPQSPSGLIQRFSRGQVLAERCQDLGSGAKTWDISGQREAKTWVFLGSADPKSWVSLSRVKVDIIRIWSFYLMRATFL